MKRSILFILTISTIAFSGEILSGTTIPLKVLNETSSNSKDEIVIIVERDILDNNNKPVIRQGTKVECDIVKARSKRRGRPGSINISFNSVRAINNQPIKLTGSHIVNGGKGKRVLSMVGTWAGLAVIFPFNFFFLLSKGEPAIIPANFQFNNCCVASNYIVN